MKKGLMILFSLALTIGVHAQEAYKCKVNGALVIQDQPCHGTVRRSFDMPTKADNPSSDKTSSSSAAETAIKTKKDQEYINERVKARNFEREKDNAAAAIQQCDAEVTAIDQRIAQVASGSPSGSPTSIASAMALQLEYERRQTEIAGLQSKVASKRHECDALRQEFDRKYRK